MKLKLKITAILVASLLLSSIPGISLAASIPFTDLTNVPAKDKITSLQEKGIIKGTGNNLFMPNNSLTAAEGIQFIVNALDLNLDTIRFIKEPKATDYFKNAKNDEWYSNALIIASVNNVKLPSDLIPTEKWTNEEFTHYLLGAIETHYEFPMINMMYISITDEAQITPEFSGSIQRSLKYGLIKLDDNRCVYPKAEITRAQAAEQIYKAVEFIKDRPTQTL